MHCLALFSTLIIRTFFQPFVLFFLAFFLLVSDVLCPLGGAQSTGRGACYTVRLGVSHHWIYIWPQGASPGFNPLRRGWVYRQAPEAPRKRECRRELPVVLGFGPATGHKLKTALCHIVGRRINTAFLVQSSLLFKTSILDFHEFNHCFIEILYISL